MKIILASQSPRRHELLKTILDDFSIIPSDFEERQVEFNGNPIDYVENLSYGKAHEVSKLYPEDLIIGMDTVVYLDGKILNKPVDENDAKSMMKLLSGKTHFVYTGFTLFSNNRNINIRRSKKTSVSFNEITDNELDNYIKGRDYEGKAGAYAIQGDAAKFIDSIEGDFYNVVGLPISELYRELKKLNVI